MYTTQPLSTYGLASQAGKALRDFIRKGCFLAENKMGKDKGNNGGGGGGCAETSRGGGEGKNFEN